MSFVLVNCKKDKTNLPVVDSTDDIYMAGYMSITSYENSVYWKNQTLVDTLPTPAGFVNTRPNCIAVVGNDVYIGGTAFDSHGFSTAIYWKNSDPVFLDSGLVSSAVSAIAVSGTDVYFSGFVTKGNDPTPVYWKNDVLFYLPVTPVSAKATTSIFVNGQDIYVGGGNTYWKNGNLAATNINGSIAAIAVSGNDLYYAGKSGEFYPNSFATYWKNGQAVLLNEPMGAGERNSDAFAISVSGSDVYILGTGFVGTTNSYTNRYWINGNGHELNNNGLALEATGIATSGKNVYISGSRSLGINTLNFVGCYWKNGEPTDFPSDENLVQPLCIFVSNN